MADVKIARLRVFPASAGVIPQINSRLTLGAGVPRECGGDPALNAHIKMTLPCSPRVRG